MLIIKPNGKIAAFISGQAMRGFGSGMKSVIETGDEQRVDQALEQGDKERAKRIAFHFAPVDDLQKAKNRRTSVHHLRSRAKVYLAMGLWDLADEAVTSLYQRAAEESQSLDRRTNDLGQAQELRKALELARKRDPHARK